MTPVFDARMDKLKSTEYSPNPMPLMNWGADRSAACFQIQSASWRNSFRKMMPAEFLGGTLSTELERGIGRSRETSFQEAMPPIPERSKEQPGNRQHSHQE